MLCMNFTYNLDIKFLTVTAEKWIIMSSLSEYVAGYAGLDVRKNIGIVLVLFPASLHCKSEGFC